MRDRAERLARVLASGPTAAEDFAIEETSTGVALECDIPGPQVNRAQSAAAALGFMLHGKVGDGRYRFEAYRRPGERGDGGFTLPGGVR
jgi:hypothetical protein